MAVKTFSAGEVLTAADTNTYLANSGEVLITGGTKSGANSYAFDNVFTSTYQNYKIVVDQLNLATGGRAIRLQFRAGGSTNTSATYNFAYNGYTTSGAAYNTSGANTTYAETGVYIDTASFELGTFISEICDPQLTKRTRALSRGIGYEAATGTTWRHGGFEFYGTNSFDGFNLTLSSTGNFSFTYSIYGMRNV